MKRLLSSLVFLASIQAFAADRNQEVYADFKGYFCSEIVSNDDSLRVDLVDACKKSKTLSDLLDKLQDIDEKCEGGPRAQACAADVKAVKNLRLAYMSGLKKGNASCKAGDDSGPVSAVKKGGAGLGKAGGSGTP